MGIEAGYIIVQKFEKKLKEGSGKIDAKGKIAKAEYEHQRILLNAQHVVAVEKVTVVDKADKMSMAECTLIKMFGQSDVAVLETVDEIAGMLEGAGAVISEAEHAA